jgi:hypothetical protein
MYWVKFYRGVLPQHEGVLTNDDDGAAAVAGGRHITRVYDLAKPGRPVVKLEIPLKFLHARLYWASGYCACRPNGMRQAPCQ